MKRTLTTLSILIVALATISGPVRAAELTTEKPNVIIVFCDDLGYGDLGCFGHPTIATPNLDRMAAEGQRWTQFYVAASVCTPSRAGLVTGRLPVRTGMCSDRRRVLFPDSAGGLQASELTIAEVMKEAGYATACFGKWHLGHLPEFLPTRHGFDTYLGIPYSNDMDRVKEYAQGKNPFYMYDWKNWNVPLIQGETVVEQPADQTQITKRYTQAAVSFIKQNADRPFFIYLPHSMVHVPLFASPEFKDTSRRGLYGDTIEEIDAGVGQIVATLKQRGIDRRTLVVFTSDNGPWLTYNEQGGSAGLLREGKGCTFEGGMREPTIFWWPGTAKPGVVRELGSTLDLLPTCAAMADVELPADLKLDGYNLLPVIKGTGPGPREVMYYYRGTRLYAIRKGPWKAHFITQGAYGGQKPITHETPELYNLDLDPSEKYNVAAANPEVVKQLTELGQQFDASIPKPESQLERRIGQ